jgi:peptidyl-tRNA hydrolase
MNTITNNPAALSARTEEDMKRWIVLVVMVMASAWTSLAFAAEDKMIGTVSSIQMRGTTAEITLQDRKTDAKVVLQVRDASTMEKLKDKIIRVGDELRVRFDKGSKVLTYVRKTAGC